MSFCEHGNKPSNSRLYKELLASEKGLCLMELVVISMPNFKITGFHSPIYIQIGIYMHSSRNSHLVFSHCKQETKKKTEVALFSNFSYLIASQSPKLNAISVASTQNLLLILT
jgi:hypothetical protein